MSQIGNIIKRKTEQRLSNLLTKIRKRDNGEAKSKCKKVHVRWKRFDSEKEEEYFVPQKCGGGYRFVTLCETETIGAIKQKAVELFFNQNNKNYFGEHVNDCLITFSESSGLMLDENTTIKSFVTQNGIYLSKTYFVLHTKTNIDDITDNPVLPLMEDQFDSALCSVNNSIELNTDLMGTFSAANRQSNGIFCFPWSHNQSLTSAVTSHSHNSSVLQVLQASETSRTTISENTELSLRNINEIDATQANQTLNDSPSVSSISHSPESISHPEVIDITDTSSTADDTNGIEQSTSAIKNTVVVRIHRMKLKDDMINVFKTMKITDKIEYVVIDPRGNLEEGVGVGVTRDILTSFWCEVLDALCIGVTERVPFVRHDLYFEEWRSIGKILVYGFEECGYFPVQMSKALVMHCLFGKVPNDHLISSFLEYVSAEEKVLLDTALQAKDPNIYNDEEFLNTLDRFNCRTRVCQLNIYAIVLELAQQELIQKPYLMVSCWANIMKRLKVYDEFLTEKNIEKFYSRTKPTTAKVVKLLQADPKNDSERDAFKFLLEYVRGLGKEMLVKFLRFLTGSDTILVEKIEVSFINLDNTAARRPIAHTCAPMLELPNSYRNFCELREEFQNILKVDCWGTDCK